MKSQREEADFDDIFKNYYKNLRNIEIIVYLCERIFTNYNFKTLKTR